MKLFNKSNPGDSVPSKVQLRQTLTQATVPPLPNNPAKADTLTQAIAIVFLAMVQLRWTL